MSRYSFTATGIADRSAIARVSVDSSSSRRSFRERTKLINVLPFGVIAWIPCSSTRSRRGDPYALALIDAMERGLSSPDEIRAATKWSASTLLAVRRRMLRAAALVARDLGGTGSEDETTGAFDVDDEGNEEEGVA